MSEKALLQKPVIDYLQKRQMDFIHIGNAGFKGKRAAYATTAYTESFSCDKYFPDLTFPWHGKVYMLEFGIPGQHKDRKEQQEIRMSYWRDVGGCEVKVITTKEQVEQLIENLERESFKHLE